MSVHHKHYSLFMFSIVYSVLFLIFSTAAVVCTPHSSSKQKTVCAIPTTRESVFMFVTNIYILVHGFKNETLLLLFIFFVFFLFCLYLTVFFSNSTKLYFRINFLNYLQLCYSLLNCVVIFLRVIVARDFKLQQHHKNVESNW